MRFRSTSFGAENFLSFGRTAARAGEYNVGMNDFDRPIGIFDSGVGGLKILEALKKALPGENFVYVFDRSHAPYGNRSARFVRRRALKISDRLVSLGAKAVVVACNTATLVAIGELHARVPVPVVGVEPPIKPAAARTPDGKILVLTTALTAKQPKFHSLVSLFDRGNIIVAPMPGLARDIEANLAAPDSLRPEVDRLLSPYDGENIRSVVLGCTHYYHIAPLISDHFGGRVKLFDACDGVTRRVTSVLGDRSLLSPRALGTTRYIYL